MSRIFYALTVLLLTIFIAPPYTCPLQAQPCTIQGLDNIDIITPTGTNIVCCDALITLPNLTFQGLPGMPNAGIMWAIYGGLPTNIDPSKDPEANVFGFSVLTGEDGNPIIGGGVADISQSGLCNTDDVFVSIVIVPIITDDSANLSFNSDCTGIELAVAYPELIVLNPDFNPEACNPDCVGGVANDDCSDATLFDLANPGPVEIAPYNNLCATSIDDPDPTTCPEFDDLGDPYNATVWFAFEGNGGQYDIGIINCPGSANEQLNNPQMALYSGNCGALAFVACSDNEVGLLPLLQDIATTNGTTYYIIVDGFNDQRGEFCFSINEDVPPPPCIAESGMLSIALSGDACAGIPFSANVTGATASSGYSSVIAIVNNSGIVVGTTTDATITVNTAGNYTAYNLNYNNDDQTTILAALEAGNPLTLIQGLIGADAVCADLSNGIDFTVAPDFDPDCNCIAEAGTLSPSSIELCYETGLLLDITASGLETGPFYITYYLWADNSATGIILQLGLTSSFAPTEAGVYSFGTINIAVEDIAALLPEPTTIDQLLDQLAAANACFDANLGGVAVILPPGSPLCLPPCLANAGTVSVADDSVCETQTLEVSVSGNNTLDFTTFYIVTNIGGEIIAVADNTSIGGLPVGDYAVFTLNLPTADADLATLQTATTVFQLNAILAGIGCFDNSDAADFVILAADSPECLPPCIADSGIISPENISECYSDDLVLTFSTTDNATDGYTTYYLWTPTDLSVYQISTLPDFMPPSAGEYYYGVLNVANTDTALLSPLPATIEALINNLDTAGACFAINSEEHSAFVLPENDPACLTCEPNAGTLPIIELPVCLGESITITANGANTDGYTTFYVIGTDSDADGTIDDILQINTSGTLNLPESSYLVQAFNIRNDFVGWLPIAPTTYTNLIISLFESCYLPSTAVLVTFINCFVCEATTGIVSYPSGNDLTVCENTAASTIIVQGDNETDIYQTIFVIVNNNGDVVGSAIDGTINFSALGLPLGSYTVYVINYHTQHAEAINNFIADGLPWADFGAITGGDACIAIDSNSVTFTVIAAGTGNCLLPLAVDNIVETVADDLLTYTVCFSVSGGSGNYIIDGQAIIGDTYCSTAIDCGTPYSFNTTDDLASGLILVQGTAPCARVCSNDAGIMPNFGGNVLVCAGETTDFESVGYVLGDDDILVYILHDDAGTELGNVLAVNTEIGGFSAATAGIQTNTIYYISAVVGLSGAGGGIVWADECTKVAEGIPVVFLQPISFDIDGTCDNSTGEFTIIALVTGGIPGFVPTESYTLSGAFNTTLSPGQTVANTFGAGTTNYTIIATDGTCSNAVNNSFECLKGTAVEWLSFDGEVLPEGNQLTWKTGTENNSDVFTIERSDDGQKFNYIGKVKAAGTSMTTRNYSFLDKTASVGANYYRLVERDLDGTTNKSDVIILVRHEARFGFTALSPIPACDNLEVIYSGIKEGMLQVAVYNTTGALVEKRHVEMQIGNNTLNINVTNYTPGVYFIRLNDGTQIISERFLVNR